MSHALDVLMVLLLALLLQAAPPPAPPVSLDRVKRELARTSILDDAPRKYPQEQPLIYRVHVRERRALEPLWKDDPAAPAYVRPRMPPTHYEFLLEVTPEEWRASTLYPCCIDLVAVYEAIEEATKRAVRSSREAQAARAVEKALRDLKPKRVR